MNELTQLQARVKALLDEKRARRSVPFNPASRYDEVYARGTAWLDGLARTDVEPPKAPSSHGQQRALADHRLCRPPPEAIDVLRLDADGEWRPDDGLPGFAFSYRILTGVTGGPPMASAVRCHCGSANCSQTLAMRKTVERWGSANGRAVPPVTE